MAATGFRWRLGSGDGGEGIKESTAERCQRETPGMNCPLIRRNNSRSRQTKQPAVDRNNVRFDFVPSPSCPGCPHIITSRPGFLPPSPQKLIEQYISWRVRIGRGYQVSKGNKTQKDTSGEDDLTRPANHALFTTFALKPKFFYQGELRGWNSWTLRFPYLGRTGPRVDLHMYIPALGTVATRPERYSLTGHLANAW
jgi:hypothetical protein